MRGYVPVARKIGGEEVYLPIEHDGSILMATFASQFPGACGLRFFKVCKETEVWLGIRVDNGYLFPPYEGWGQKIYYCVWPHDYDDLDDDSDDEYDDDENDDHYDEGEDEEDDGYEYDDEDDE